MTEQSHFHFLLSCLENSRDSKAWWAVVYGVAQNQTWQKRLSSSSSKVNQESWGNSSHSVDSVKVSTTAAAKGRMKDWKYMSGFAQRPAASYDYCQLMGSLSLLLLKVNQERSGLLCSEIIMLPLCGSDHSKNGCLFSCWTPGQWQRHHHPHPRPTSDGNIHPVS